MNSPRTRRAPRTRLAPRPWTVGLIGGMASYIDAAAIISSGIALVQFQEPLRLAEGEIGGASAALTLSIAAGALVGGRLGDRFGRRSVFIATMLVIAAGTAFVIFGGSFLPLVTGMILIGFGTGADLPVSLASISEAASDHNRGKLVGFTQVMWYLGITSTSLISIFTGTMGYLGGQILFAHVGIIAVIVLFLRLIIPESQVWLQAREERRSGATTVRAKRAGIRDILTNRVYLVPFVSLLGFYTFTNLGANTIGQFGYYIAVNVAGFDIPTYSTIALIALIASLPFAVWFLRVVDGQYRMRFFLLGGFFFVAAYLTPALFGFNFTTIIIQSCFELFGYAFAFEGIMKVWTQESFPTLLRSTAQGAIIAVARVAAAALALFTPSLLNSPQVMYGIIAIVIGLGVLIGWLGFRGRRLSSFVVEDRDISTDTGRS